METANRHCTFLLGIALAFAPALPAQGQSILGRNLVVNGDAESGAGINDQTSSSASVPGWTIRNNFTVLKYSDDTLLRAQGRGPNGRGANYFAGGPNTGSSSATQTIDVTASAAAIDGTTIGFSLSGYLGGAATNSEDNAFLKAVFRGQKGESLLAVSTEVAQFQNRLGMGMLLRNVHGLVPAGTRQIEVQLAMQSNVISTYNGAVADNIALVLSSSSLLGPNLVEDGDFEASEAVTDIGDDGWSPGWNFTGTQNPPTAVSYRPDGYWPSARDSGPDDRGSKLLVGGLGLDAQAFQTIDVTAGATTIDSGAVTYTLAGWLGGYLDTPDYATVRVEFRDANNSIVGRGATQPVKDADRGSKTGLWKRQAQGTVPGGTRKITVMVDFTDVENSWNLATADSISLVLASTVSNVRIASGGIVNAASGAGGPISPGEIVAINGSGLGPTETVRVQQDSKGYIATVLAGVKLLVDGVPAPLLFVQGGQMNAIVPYGVAGKSSVQVQVDNNGVKSDAVAMQVAATSPGMLTVSGKPADQALAYNADFTLNSAANAAAKGSSITVFFTGAGQTVPGGVDGLITTTSLPKPAAAVTATIGGQTAQVVTVNAVPWSWSGLFEAVLQVPSGAAAGDKVPVVLTSGGVKSQENVTVAVK